MALADGVDGLRLIDHHCHGVVKADLDLTAFEAATVRRLAVEVLGGEPDPNDGDTLETTGRGIDDLIVIGSDDSFPPADHHPLTSLRAAGFSAEEIHRIGEANPRRLFRLP